MPLSFGLPCRSHVDYHVGPMWITVKVLSCYSMSHMSKIPYFLIFIKSAEYNTFLTLLCSAVVDGNSTAIVAIEIKIPNLIN